jgi:hypothetical protein
MKTAAFIVVGALAAWWLLLTVFLAFSYRKRVREARTPLTAEEIEECRQLDSRLPRLQMRPIHFVLISPVVLLMLPLYLYGWLVNTEIQLERTRSLCWKNLEINTLLRLL